MKEEIRRMSSYLFVLFVLFYVFPLVIKDTGSGMFILLLVTPAILLITGFVYGIRKGFSILPSILTGILFIPGIYIYYNDSAWIYAGIFPVFMLFGTGIGRMFYGKR